MHEDRSVARLSFAVSFYATENLSVIDLKDLANRLRSEGLSGKVKVVGFFYDAVGLRVMW